MTFPLTPLSSIVLPPGHLELRVPSHAFLVRLALGSLLNRGLEAGNAQFSTRDLLDSLVSICSHPPPPIEQDETADPRSSFKASVQGLLKASAGPGVAETQSLSDRPLLSSLLPFSSTPVPSPFSIPRPPKPSPGRHSSIISELGKGSAQVMIHSKGKSRGGCSWSEERPKPEGGIQSAAPRAAQGRRRKEGAVSPWALGRGSRDLRRRCGGLDPEERGGVAGVGGARGAEGCGAL